MYEELTHVHEKTGLASNIHTILKKVQAFNEYGKVNKGLK